MKDHLIGLGCLRWKQKNRQTILNGLDWIRFLVLTTLIFFIFIKKYALNQVFGPNNLMICSFQNENCEGETELRYFQFKILHRYIGVNENLYKFGYVDSNLCTFCNVEIESIPHLFWQCDISTRFWKDVQDHVLKKYVTLTMKDVILGILDIDSSIYNFVNLHAKQYIYNARCNDHRLNVTAFKKQLKNIYTIEKYIAEKNDRVEEWQRKWNSINMWLPFI